MKPTVAIIGLGLIGGSLGQALRRSKKYKVIGIARRAKTAREAKRRGAVDRASMRLADVASADIVVICSPLDAIIPLFKRIVPFLKPGAIVTDAGSVKEPILRAAARVKRPASVHFMGGHPLAGSHRTGVEASSFRLFEGSTVVLVPGSRTALSPLKALWRVAGAKTLVLTAKEHDRAVALISHLPHALAHALVHLIARARDRRRLASLVAGSFRDATRVASADPSQWAQIFGANARPLRDALRSFRRELSRFENNLSRSSLQKHLKVSQAFRRPLFHGK